MGILVRAIIFHLADISVAHFFSLVKRARMKKKTKGHHLLLHPGMLREFCPFHRRENIVDGFVTTEIGEVEYSIMEIMVRTHPCRLIEFEYTCKMCLFGRRLTSNHHPRIGITTDLIVTI